MHNIQVNHIILGLKDGNHLAFDTEAQSFVNLGNAKAEAYQETDALFLLEKIKTFITENQNVISPNKKSEVKSLLEYKLSCLQSKYYRILKFFWAFFNTAQLQKHQNQENEIIRIIDNLKDKIPTLTNATGLSRPNPDQQPRRLNFDAIDLTNRNHCERTQSQSEIDALNEQFTFEYIELFISNDVVLNQRLKLPSHRVTTPVQKPDSPVKNQPPQGNKSNEETILTIIQKSNLAVLSPIKPAVKSHSVAPHGIQSPQTNGIFKSPNAIRTVRFLNTPQKNNGLSRASIKIPNAPEAVFSTYTINLNEVAKAPAPAFEVLGFENEPAPLNFDGGPQGYQGQAETVIQDQIKQIEAYIAMLEASLSPVKNTLDTYDQLLSKLKSVTELYESIDKEQTKYKNILFQILQIEKDQQPRLFKIGSKPFPIFPDSRVEAIKKRHAEWIKEKESKINSVSQSITKVEEEIALLAKDSTDEMQEKNEKLEKLKKELEEIQNIPPFPIHFLFPALKVSSAKEKMTYILDNFKEWNSESANQYFEQIQNYEEEIAELKLQQNNHISFDQFKEVHEQKMSEIDKWKRFKARREEYLQKKTQVYIQPTSNLSNATGINPLLDAFPELIYIQNMHQSLPPILGPNRGDEEGFWKAVSLEE